VTVGNRPRCSCEAEIAWSILVPPPRRWTRQCRQGAIAKIDLRNLCTEEGEKIALSRRVDNFWRLVDGVRFVKVARLKCWNGKQQQQ
jgi:hypothetical protein